MKKLEPLTEAQMALCWQNIRACTSYYIANDQYNSTENQEFSKKLSPNLDAIEDWVRKFNQVGV